MTLEDLAVLAAAFVSATAVLLSIALLVDRRRLKTDLAAEIVRSAVLAARVETAETPLLIPSEASAAVALTNAVGRVEAALEASGNYPPAEVGLAARVKAIADLVRANEEIEANLSTVGARLTDLGEISARVEALEALLIPRDWDDPARVAFDFLVARNRARLLADLQGAFGRMVARPTGLDAAAYEAAGLDA